MSYDLCFNARDDEPASFEVRREIEACIVEVFRQPWGVTPAL